MTDTNRAEPMKGLAEFLREMANDGTVGWTPDRLRRWANEVEASRLPLAGAAPSEDAITLAFRLPGVTYMDPPAGGAPTILEQLQRQAKDARRYIWLRDRSNPGIWAFYLSVGEAFKNVRFARETVDNAIDAQIEAEHGITLAPIAGKGDGK